MTEVVEIFETGPRDGLQNEKHFIPTTQKIKLVDMLSAAGFRRIEVTSFVSPKWIPQMSDAAEVMTGISRHQGVSYAALTPNMTGYNAARAAKADEVAVFVSASEGFSRANLNATIAETFERFVPIMAMAKADGVRVRGYISMVTECPFDGPTPPGKVANVASRLLEMGCYEISLGDTTGQARAESVDAMLNTVLDEVPVWKLAGHFHNTSGRAIENIAASLARGLRVFDAAVGGLGGCPYAPGAEGNIATERVAEFLETMGYKTNLNLSKLNQVADFARYLSKSTGQP